MTKDAKLKPCPFCGVVPLLSKSEYLHPPGLFQGYHVSCQNRTCFVKPSTYEQAPFMRSWKGTISRWNNRKRKP